MCVYASAYFCLLIIGHTVTSNTASKRVQNVERNVLVYLCLRVCKNFVNICKHFSQNGSIHHLTRIWEQSVFKTVVFGWERLLRERVS